MHSKTFRQKYKMYRQVFPETPLWMDKMFLLFEESVLSKYENLKKFPSFDRRIYGNSEFAIFSCINWKKKQVLKGKCIGSAVAGLIQWFYANVALDSRSWDFFFVLDWWIFCILEENGRNKNGNLRVLLKRKSNVSNLSIHVIFENVQSLL